MTTTSSSAAMRAATWCALASTLAIGATSFVMSFAALADLAHQAGQPRQLAWLWPVIVDGTILQATVSVVALAPRATARAARRYFWAVLAVAASVSVAGNALHAAVSGAATLDPVIAALVATVAPVSLLAATHGLAILVRTPTTNPARTATAFDDPAEPNTEPAADVDRDQLVAELAELGFTHRAIAEHVRTHVPGADKFAPSTVSRILRKRSEEPERERDEPAESRDHNHSFVLKGA